MNPYLSIIIPIYNGGPEIDENIRAVLGYVDGKDFATEVILVNDGSTDGTAESLERVKDGRVVVVDNGRNRGKGYSVRNGMLKATGKYRIFFDADLAYPVEQTDNLLRLLEEGADISIGSRVHSESRFIVHCFDLKYVVRRYIMSRVFNFFLRRTLLKDIKDSQSGFKGFTAEAAESVFSRQTSEDFSFDLEILFIAQKKGFIVREVPVTQVFHGEPSSVSFFRDSTSMLVTIARVWYNYLAGRYK